jgi:hypothetical protein
MGESAALRQYSFIGENYLGQPGPYHWIECPLEGPALPQQGVNAVEVRLRGRNPTVTTAVAVSDVEIVVKQLTREGAQVSAREGGS